MSNQKFERETLVEQLVVIDVELETAFQLALQVNATNEVIQNLQKAREIVENSREIIKLGL